MRWTDVVHESRFAATVDQVKRRNKDAEARLPGVPEKNSPVQPLLLSASAVGLLVALRRSPTLRRTLKRWATAPWNALQQLTQGSGKKPALTPAGQTTGGNRGPVASTSKASTPSAPTKPTTPKAQPKPAPAPTPKPAPAAAAAASKPSTPAEAVAAAALAPRPTPFDDQPVASTSGASSSSSSSSSSKKKNKKKNKKK